MWQCMRLCTFVRLMFLLCINSLTQINTRARVPTNVYTQRERERKRKEDSVRPVGRQTLLFSKCNIVGSAHDYSIGKCHYKTRMKKNKYWSINWFGRELAAEFMARKNHLLCNTFSQKKCVCKCVCISQLNLLALCVNYSVDELTKQYKSTSAENIPSVFISIAILVISFSL